MSSSPSSHCMKEEFCGCETGIETVLHETLGRRYFRFTLKMWQSSILKTKSYFYRVNETEISPNPASFWNRQRLWIGRINLKMRDPLKLGGQSLKIVSVFVLEAFGLKKCCELPTHLKTVFCKRKISAICFHILLLVNYMRLHSNLEPAAINIFRDITKFRYFLQVLGNIFI